MPLSQGCPREPSVAKLKKKGSEQRMVPPGLSQVISSLVLLSRTLIPSLNPQNPYQPQQSLLATDQCCHRC